MQILNFDLRFDFNFLTLIEIKLRDFMNKMLKH